MAGNNPNRIKAYEIYAANNGNIDLVDIATQLSVPDGTVRGWKSKDKWDIKINGTFQLQKEERENETERSTSDNEHTYNWIDVERDYVTDVSNKPISLEKIAKKYGIPRQTVFDYSRKCNWTSKKREYKETTIRKIMEKDSNKDANRITRLLNTTDKVMDKLDKAVEELETYMVMDKKKKVVKLTLVDEYTGKPKGTQEIQEESTEINTVLGIVDKQGLANITNSLKNVKELYGVLKSIEEQDARIATMKSKVIDQSDDDETGVVMLAPVLPDVEEEGE